MNELFNTPFEVSLRVLLTLLVAGKKRMTLDMIAARDYLTIYSRDFGIGDYNLHGDNSFSFGEFASRRKLTSEAIRLLVTENLIHAVRDAEGFRYELNTRGRKVCDSFTTDYAAEYISLAQEVRDFTENKTEIETMKLINEKATSVQERRGGNG